MAAGSISGDEFVKLAHNFLVLAEKTKDSWKIKEIPDKQYYLSKKEVKKISRQHIEQKQYEELTCIDKEDDCQLELSSTECVTYEYHVVYSHSYNVPVLYFNVYHQNGKLLSLDEVWSDIPECYRDRLLEERWSFITQQEHPLLGRPFFMLHPCHTKDLMAQVTSIQDDGQRNYLLSWLCAVGPVVGLKMSPLYGYEHAKPGD
ncbi:ubiquitin-like-conjugating enzyme ATG10 [Mytilus californianus]|uniref:ubiquitin-like-conjugating enzyme ATG10 n=1 Tax=Mytilus californianus TaxID=6549 RepID=UPI0022458A6E|nr:ubiquitin-like-conjugating enzyme ATG10 [Mytilus californianus]